jgi:3-oxoacyl-[acyl-carrier protein] reductase
MKKTDKSRRTLLAAAAATPLLFASGAAIAGPHKHKHKILPGSGRSALVTGSSRGIGAATAKRLAQDGYAVTVNCRVQTQLAAEVVAEIKAAGGRAIFRQADVADSDLVREMFDDHVAAFGGIDIVVSNAAMMFTAPIAQMTDDAFDRMMDTNVKGSFNVLREAARRIRDGGRIITLSSSAVIAKNPTLGPYAASKSVQEQYAGALAKELAGRNISVNAIAPGPTNTSLFNPPADQREQAIARIPYGRIGEPEDIANAIAALCSNDGQWFNGQLLFANGGYI